MITIIDYGMGNIGSIVNMLKKLGIKSQTTISPIELLEAEKIILPGVGAFDNAMEKLNRLGFSEVIRKKAVEGTPILGICLGMQLLGTSSEEGVLDGLNLIPAKIRKFCPVGKLKVPHMGWNRVRPLNQEMYQNLEENRFYFVHSYYFDAEEENDIAGTTDYGIRFASSVRRRNVYGAQFHPEKSHKYGMQFLRNFNEI
ncbi:MAG: imidazole glycerol phosphate synthase subunit HisH [Saprospiraceae bacterium]|nr:imidazole glycerol phosphate synthase subunit HisH [Saprospiraceae bacterium]